MVPVVTKHNEIMRIGITAV